MIRFHDCRHTTATIMLSHGIPAVIVAGVTPPSLRTLDPGYALAAVIFGGTPFVRAFCAVVTRPFIPVAAIARREVRVICRDAPAGRLHVTRYRLSTNGNQPVVSS